MAPPAGGVTGDVDAHFHHQLGFHQRDDQFFLAAPPGGERPARPRMTAPPSSQKVGDRSTRLGESGGAADVLKAASVVYLPSSSVRGVAREPVTAPTIVSLVSRTLYFCQPLVNGR